jgi:inorganic pyrophosphatase
MRYPGNYGFIPHTLSADGDPCDVIVANTRAIAPGAVMSCRPVGVLLMEDEAGGDEKIIAVPSNKLTRRYEKVENYSDLPQITLQQIESPIHFKTVSFIRHGESRWNEAQAKKNVMEMVSHVDHPLNETGYAQVCLHANEPLIQ